ncbi:inhibitor of nuclear factor kappa-B kinase subunit epsilon [Pectinophora gossypiella]|nr:inhibitor of nuclear factor kappa-B kinase subunit epsilon [Pectinophora gossypiella]
MSFLRGSENYVWCTTSVLGKGATGAVFQGVNKNNGEPVAVKTFNQLSHMRPHDVQMREFEVLKKVKHENIVKLLAIEEEQEGRGKVIVMELCTGGSLFNILDDPENTYGLQEHEFLLVLEHLTAGMKHLRDNNLVHRDLKPGNIMKYINEDGTTTYKLTDFGAARELQEEEQFVSLYGTEEYLHPDMYERAVLRKPVGKSFGATVDLWSIGVTLYHVATGQLPFRPYGGRRNKETMFYITTKKASGVISGTQTTENGPIEWSRELPSHCQLSVGLRKLVTPLLAGLLEVDPHRIWTFDRFFSEVQMATSTKPVHIFHVNKAASIKVFLKPEEKFEHLQTYICEQTSVVAESQILLYKEKLLLSEIDENTLGKSYPDTSAEEPLLLFNKNNNNVSMAPEPDAPKFPVFPNIVSVENDATQAKTACSVGHVIKRRVEALCAASVLCGACVRRWGALVTLRLQAVAARADQLATHSARLHDAARALDLANSAARALSGLAGGGAEGAGGGAGGGAGAGGEAWAEGAARVAGEATSLRAAAAALAARHAAGAALRAEWDAAARQAPCPSDLRLHVKARTLVERLRESWQHLVRDRATRSLTYNDEQFHVLERITVAETGRRARALLQRAAPQARARADAIADWYKVAQTLYLQTQILDKDVSSTELKLLALAARLQDAEHRTRAALNDAQAQLNASKLASEPIGERGKEAGRRAAGAGAGVAGVGAMGAGVRALLAAQGELAAAAAGNSALLARLTRAAKQLPP